MNFVFVDRILQLIPGEKTLALKHVTANDSYLTMTPDDKPALISCVVGEALGQLCSWNVIQSSEFNLRLIGGIVGEVAIHEPAYVGDTIVMESYIDRLDLDNQVVSFHGIARVGDRLILEVNNGLGPLLPIAEFGYTDRVKKEFKHLYRPGDIPTIPNGKLIECNTSIDKQHLTFDRIIQWNSGKNVVAQKNISMISPFFRDHFPARPVFPLSLLIETKLQLAYPFIAEIIENKKSVISPVAVRRIKMNDFISPGDIIFTHMKLKEHYDDRFILSFRTELEGRRICVCEAEFKVA